MTTPTRTAKSALDQFLPERIFAPNAQRNGGATRIDAGEVQIEPIEMFKQPAPATATPSNVTPSTVTQTTRVQLWPMLAAALVAFGVALLAFAAFAKFNLP